MADQWEYWLFLLAKLDHDELNALGADGWEAVGIAPSYLHNIGDQVPGNNTQPDARGRRRKQVGSVVNSYIVLFKRRKP
jgi:hypothetical protein